MPKVTVGAILTRSSGNNTAILLTRRNVEPFRGFWCIPGGHVEQHEDAVTAVQREVMEETNLRFTPQFFMYFDEIFPGRNVHNVVLVFHGEASGEVKAAPAEVSETGWFSLDEALGMELAFRHGDVLALFADRLRHKPAGSTF